MLQFIFNFIINFLISVVQFVTAGLNLILEQYLPDLSSSIVTTMASITGFFNNLTWPLSLVPTGILNTLVFILTIEIARHTIYISTHVLIRVWNLFQKVKFW